MPDQETCARPVIVTLPAQINAATAEQAAEQISAAFTPGVTVVIADLTPHSVSNRRRRSSLWTRRSQPPDLH